jgi:hypothetical protein
MKKILALIIACLIFVSFVTGCGKADRMIAKYTGYSNICVDGVSYLQFTSGATVKVGLDGKPIACK